ncbi:MAG: DUF4013 domain-containing protein [Candidatus Gastranaerophilales bacterium]|nr:DUF4013 domain-containing protein [Candidatus Gastranaerophilales bacterium]
MKCNVNMRKAFDSIFNQPHYAKKLILGGVFSLLATLLINLYACLYLPTIIDKQGLAVLVLAIGIIGVVVHFVLSCLIMGYNIKFVNNMLTDKSEILPYWSNFKELFSNGFKWLLISVIYYSLVIIVSIGLTKLCIIPYEHSHLMSFFFLVPIAFIFIASAILPLLETMFAHRLRIKDAFNYVRAVGIIAKNFWQYIILLLFTFGIYLLAVIPYTISAITIVGTILIPFVAFIVKLLVRNLFAQFYKSVLEREGL